MESTRVGFDCFVTMSRWCLCARQLTISTVKFCRSGNRRGALLLWSLVCCQANILLVRPRPFRRIRSSRFRSFLGFDRVYSTVFIMNATALANLSVNNINKIQQENTNLALPAIVTGLASPLLSRIGTLGATVVESVGRRHGRAHNRRIQPSIFKRI